MKLIKVDHFREREGEKRTEQKEVGTRKNKAKPIP
jgi:hypothetical protein